MIIKKVRYIKRRIENKFGSKDWYYIVTKAFDYGTLRKTDFVERQTQRFALEYANTIVDFYNNLDKNDFPLTKIVNYFIEFYKTNSEAIAKEKRKDLDIDFTNANKKFYSSELHKLGINSDIHFDQKQYVPLAVRESIFSKFKARNTFSCFRKALQIDVLHKAEFATINVEQYAFKIANRTIKELAKWEGTMRLMIVHKALINYYNDIEFDYLMKLKNQKKLKLTAKW